jgi:hypothetical protein
LVCWEGKTFYRLAQAKTAQASRDGGIEWKGDFFLPDNFCNYQKPIAIYLDAVP